MHKLILASTFLIDVLLFFYPANAAIKRSSPLPNNPYTKRQALSRNSYEESNATTLKDHLAHIFNNKLQTDCEEFIENYYQQKKSFPKPVKECIYFLKDRFFTNPDVIKFCNFKGIDSALDGHTISTTDIQKDIDHFHLTIIPIIKQIENDLPVRIWGTHYEKSSENDPIPIFYMIISAQYLRSFIVQFPNKFKYFLEDTYNNQIIYKPIDLNLVLAALEIRVVDYAKFIISKLSLSNIQTMNLWPYQAKVPQSSSSTNTFSFYCSIYYTDPEFFKTNTSPEEKQIQFTDIFLQHVDLLRELLLFLWHLPVKGLNINNFRIIKTSDGSSYKILFIGYGLWFHTNDNSTSSSHNDINLNQQNAMHRIKELVYSWTNFTRDDATTFLNGCLQFINNNVAHNEIQGSQA